MTATNGKVKINLDKERTLFYNLNALVLLEEQGIDISKLTDGVSMKAVRGIVWAGLQHEDKEITVADVGELITLENFETISTAIGEAFKSNGKK